MKWPPSTGIITTIAGTGVNGFTGGGGPAINFSDSLNDRVRAYTIGGDINTVAGNRSATSPTPSISAVGAVSVSAFGEFTSISPGGWIEVYGSSLATDTRS